MGYKVVNSSIYKILGILSFAVLMLSNVSIVANAQGEAVTLEGTYRHPYTSAIEDSGGESSFALGESMVKRMVSTEGTFDPESQYGSILSFQMGLMDSITEVQFSIQEKGQEEWVDVDFGRQTIAEDRAEFKVPFQNKSDVIRAKCHVAPMGRAVTFFISIPGAADEATGGVLNDAGDMGTSEDSAQETADDLLEAKPTNTNKGLTIGGPGITDSSSEDGAQEGSKGSEGQASDDFLTKLNTMFAGASTVEIIMLVFSFLIFFIILLVSVYCITRHILIKRNKTVDKRIFDKTEREEAREDESLEIMEFDASQWEDEEDEE